MISADRLRELLNYNPNTGVFTRRITVSSRARAGEPAGHSDGNGYLQICLDGKHYRAHRLAWLYMTGEWPDLIDHIDTDRSNNRWANLRLASLSANAQNTVKARSHNKSSRLLGAYRNHGRWRSCILIDGRNVYLGSFGTAEEAHAAYVAAKRKHHEGCTL